MWFFFFLVLANLFVASLCFLLICPSPLAIFVAFPLLFFFPASSLSPRIPPRLSLSLSINLFLTLSLTLSLSHPLSHAFFSAEWAKAHFISLWQSFTFFPLSLASCQLPLAFWHHHHFPSQLHSPLNIRSNFRFPRPPPHWQWKMPRYKVHEHETCIP